MVSLLLACSISTCIHHISSYLSLLIIYASKWLYSYSFPKVAKKLKQIQKLVILLNLYIFLVDLGLRAQAYRNSSKVTFWAFHFFLGLELFAWGWQCLGLGGFYLKICVNLAHKINGFFSKKYFLYKNKRITYFLAFD